MRRRHQPLSRLRRFHDGKSGEESAVLNFRIILLLANRFGDGVALLKIAAEDT